MHFFIMKKQLIIITLCLVSLEYTFSRNFYDPTDNLIAAYCTGKVGNHTLTALQQANEMLNMVKDFRDSECQNIYYDTLSLHSSLTLLDSLSKKNDLHQTQLKVNELADQINLEKVQLEEAYRQNYMLNNPGASQNEIDVATANFIPSSSYLALLESEYANSKINLINLEVNKDDFDKLAEREYRMDQLNLFQQNAQNLMASMKGSTQCLQNKPNLIAQLGAQIVGATSSIYGGVVGGLAMGAGILVSGASELISHIKFNSSINKLRNNRLNVAIGCTLEGLAETYCRARDTQVTLNHIQDYHEEESCEGCEDLRVGFELLSKKIQPFDDWIIRITAGSSPSNAAQAEGRIQVFELRVILDSLKQFGFGNINEAIAAENALKDPKRKNEIRLGLMRTLAGMVAQQTVTTVYEGTQAKTKQGPYFSAFAADPQCGPFVYFFSKGEKRQATLKPGEQCNAYILDNYGDVTNNPHLVSEIQALFQDINKEANTFVANKIQQVLEENPDLVMAQIESIHPLYGNSPLQFLNEAQAYLKKLNKSLDDEEQQNLKKLVIKTIDQIQNALNINNGVCPEESPCEEAASKVSQIGLILAPNQQTLNISNAFREIVKQDVDLKLLKGAIKNPSLNFLLRLSSENSSDVLLRNYLGIQESKEDTSQAKNLTEKNMTTFANLFRKNIINNIKHLYRKYNKEGIHDYQMELSQRCIQALLIPGDSKVYRKNKFNKKLMKYCKNSTLLSAYEKSVKSLKFTDLAQRPFQERVCSLYDFRRKLQLVELLPNKKLHQKTAE